jgi:hypothetical protein
MIFLRLVRGGEALKDREGGADKGDTIAVLMSWFLNSQKGGF